MKQLTATGLAALLALGLAIFVSPTTNVIAQEYHRDFDTDDLDDDLYDDLMDDDPYEDGYTAPYGWNGANRGWGDTEADWWENHPYYNEDAWDDSTAWFDGNNYELEEETSQAGMGEEKANVAVAEEAKAGVYEF